MFEMVVSVKEREVGVGVGVHPSFPTEYGRIGNDSNI